MAAPNVLVERAEKAGVTVREMVVRAVEETGGVAQAARALGCGVTTVRHHLKGARIEQRTVARVVWPADGGERGAA